MVLPEPPYVMGGQQAVEAVADTPRWTRVTLSNGRIARPQEGLIVIAYKAEAERDATGGQAPERYTAHCTSTYRLARTRGLAGGAAPADPADRCDHVTG